MVPTSTESGDKVRVGVLINPLSGRNRRDSGEITQTLSRYHQVEHHEVRTVAEIRDTLVAFGRNDVTLLVISGGDGTVQAVLTILFTEQPFRVQPEIIVLAGGTTNMIAGDVGISGDQKRALKRVFQYAQQAGVSVSRIERSILRLQVPGHGVKYGMFFGAGVISQGVLYYREHLHNKKMRGFPGICMTIGRFLWALVCRDNQRLVATPIGLGLDGQAVQNEEIMLVFVSTLERLFFGLRPFWGSENGRLHFTAVRSPARYLFRVLPFAARGRAAGKATRENGYYSHNVDELSLYLSASVALDGELYTPASSQEPTVLHYGGRITFLRL